MKLILKLFCLLLVLVLSFSPISGAFAATQGKPKNSDLGAENKSYPILRIGPGDLLSIFVYGENTATTAVLGGLGTGTLGELPTDYQVDSKGVIAFPFLGRVTLAGLTPVEASEKIASLLSKPKKVTVLIKESNTYWVSILGNVARPGKYQIKGQFTLMSALSEAGGPLPDSNLGGAILIHNNQKTKLNLNKYFHEEGPAQSAFLYPGDVLMVKKSDWPSLGEWAIVASILASLAVVTVDLSNIRK